MLSIKKAAVLLALVSGSQGKGWFSNLFKRESDRPPQEVIEYGDFGEEIIHDKSVNISDRASILDSEDVDLKKLRQDFMAFSEGRYVPKERPNVKSEHLDVSDDGEYI